VKVPKIIGTHGKILWGLVPSSRSAKTRWIIEDSAEQYIQMIREYEGETDPTKKHKLLEVLTYISDFNEMQVSNKVGQFKVSQKKVFDAYNANVRDVMNTFPEGVDALATVRGGMDEDSLIDSIDAKQRVREQIADEQVRKPRKPRKWKNIAERASLLKEVGISDSGFKKILHERKKK
jgi:hypothetical protein